MICFSVVIPLYNKEQTILKTVASVLTQTYQNFEIIVVNDGSTDNGVSLLGNTFQDDRIRIINQENQGVSAARNNGIRNAKYDYIALLDGDDEWLPGYLAKVKVAIEKFPDAGMYGSASWHVNTQTGFSGNSTLLKYRGKIEIVDYLQCPTLFSHTSATVFSKTKFDMLFPDGNGFPVGQKRYEDWTCQYQFAFTSPYVYIGFPLGVRNNEVAGQATGDNIENRGKEIWSDFVNFYRLSWERYVATNKKSKTYLTFMKFELRGVFINALRRKNYKHIDFLLNHLNANILKCFSRFELSLYSNPSKRILALLYIYITKFIWRFNKIPR